MTNTSWTDIKSGFYCPFEEKGWLWTNAPYFVFLLVNCLYFPIFLSCGIVVLAILVILAIGLVIGGGGGYLIYRFPLKSLYISLRYKDGEAKSRIRNLWALDTPTTPTTENPVPTTLPMCADRETNISDLHFW